MPEPIPEPMPEPMPEPKPEIKPEKPSIPQSPGNVGAKCGGDYPDCWNFLKCIDGTCNFSFVVQDNTDKLKIGERCGNSGPECDDGLIC